MFSRVKIGSDAIIARLDADRKPQAVAWIFADRHAPDGC
jgi:hypothetical protein